MGPEWDFTNHGLCVMLASQSVPSKSKFLCPKQTENGRGAAMRLFFCLFGMEKRHNLCGLRQPISALCAICGSKNLHNQRIIIIFAV